MRRTPASFRSALYPSFVLLATACGGGGDPFLGLGLRPANDVGPLIVWDVDARPLPDIPFPNDIGTRTDSSSPTGLRVNVSEVATTRHESRLRRLVNRQDGFGTFAPLSVRFAERIDIVDLYARQTDADPRNDGLYLVDITDGADSFGQSVRLDFGSGPPHFSGARFSVGVELHDQYFPADPRAVSSNLVFETETEASAARQDDTDDDGHLDRGNLWGEVLGDPRLLDRNTHLLTAYELETDTLLFRPLVPLHSRHRYAVVLTRRILGADSRSPIRSPFPTINHVQQTRALGPLVEAGLLGELGLGLDDVAFTWSFTTQSTTEPMLAIRAGLEGEGPLGWLAERYPPKVTSVLPLQQGAANNFIFPTAALVGALNDPRILTVLQIPEEQSDQLAADYLAYVDYFVFGSFESPSFLQNDDGAFDINPEHGRAEVGRETIYFNCAIPKASAGSQPYPVVLYQHGSGSTRLEILGFAAVMARYGMATCGMDAWGHGLIDNEVIRGLADAILGEQGLSELGAAIFAGRSRDLNADGFSDSGGDFWTADIVHTRDCTRQTVIDMVQFVRVLSAFGQGTMPVDADADGDLELAGDFDADGVVDLGGGQPLYAMGQSLGGIMTAVLAGIEPRLTAAVPVAAGGGLVDVAVRSEQPGMLQAVFLPILGPLVVGKPLSGGRVQLFFHALDVISEKEIPFAVVPDAEHGHAESVEAGDVLRLENLDNGEVHEILLRDPQNFRVPIAADRGDRLRLSLWRDGAIYRTIDTYEQLSFTIEAQGFQGQPIALGDPLRALHNGFGYRRGTPSLRRLVGFAQMIVDPADPAAFAPLWQTGPSPRQVSLFISSGDVRVPVGTGLTLARAAGLLDPARIDPRYGVSAEQLLLDHWVGEGLDPLRRFAGSACHYDEREVLFDMDDAAEGRDPLAGPTLTRPRRHPACVADPRTQGCEPSCEPQPPLRLTLPSAGGGVTGLRMMYLSPQGAHSFRLPDPSLPFDYPRYIINQIAWYFATGGRELVDRPCLATLAGCGLP